MFTLDPIPHTWHGPLPLHPPKRRNVWRRIEAKSEACQGTLVSWLYNQLNVTQQLFLSLSLPSSQTPRDGLRSVLFPRTTVSHISTHHSEPVSRRSIEGMPSTLPPLHHTCRVHVPHTSPDFPKSPTSHLKISLLLPSPISDIPRPKKDKHQSPTSITTASLLSSL
jgi:hypothetical protein